MNRGLSCTPGCRGCRDERISRKQLHLHTGRYCSQNANEQCYVNYISMTGLYGLCQDQGLHDVVLFENESKTWVMSKRGMASFCFWAERKKQIKKQQCNPVWLIFLFWSNPRSSIPSNPAKFLLISSSINSLF